jgi:hypothetical protein
MTSLRPVSSALSMRSVRWVIVPPSEAEALRMPRMPQSRFLFEKARFRLATIDLLTAIHDLVEYAPAIAEIYTDMLIIPAARVVAVGTATIGPVRRGTVTGQHVHRMMLCSNETSVYASQKSLKALEASRGGDRRRP